MLHDCICASYWYSLLNGAGKTSHCSVLPVLFDPIVFFFSKG